MKTDPKVNQTANKTMNYTEQSANQCTLTTPTVRQSSADGVIFFLIIGFLLVAVIGMMGNFHD